MSNKLSHKFSTLSYVSVLFLSIPFTASAQGCSEPGLMSYICGATYLIYRIIPVVFALAIVFFFWGITRSFIHSDDEKVRDESRRIMLWGVIAIFVALSVWGIIYIFGHILGTPSGGILIPYRT